MCAAETNGATSPTRWRDAWRSLGMARRPRLVPVSDPALYQRIQAAALPINWRPGLFGWTRREPFVEAVAEDLQLMPDHAERVVREYRRFLYLCAVSEARLTPSEIVDSVWHNHLERAEEAYERFCAKVIGAPIVHTPGLSKAESAEGYSLTLDRYAAEFGEAAPESVWTTPATFGRIRRAERVFCTGVALSVLAAFAVGIWFHSFDAEASIFNAAVFLVGLVITFKSAGASPIVIKKGEASGASCGG